MKGVNSKGDSEFIVIVTYTTTDGMGAPTSLVIADTDLGSIS